MRKQLFSTNLFKLLAILTLASGSLVAKESREGEGNVPSHESPIKAGEKRDVVGSTQMSIQDQIKRRDLLAKEEIENKDEESAEKCSECRSVKSDEDKDDGKESKAWVYASIFVHNIIAKAWDSSWLELEDGSTWNIVNSQRYIIQNWYTTDVLYLTQNSWLSAYKYVIVNDTLGTQVEVNQYTCAILGGAYTRYVTSIDYTYGIATLNDGTVWIINSSDMSYLQNWLPGDTVTLGINSGWFKSESPYILVNGKVNDFIRASLY
jgi:hypothetical protein